MKNQSNLVFHDYNDMCDDSAQRVNTTDCTLQNNLDQNSDNSNSVYRTKSGRNVKLPSKYDNYVT